MNRLFFCFTILCFLDFFPSKAQNEREHFSFDDDWLFTLGNATDKQKDFTYGTEYFTYIAKVQSNLQSKSPTWNGFDDSHWTQIKVPHDWVVDLPFNKEASHSHGYKVIGWKYPGTSVGWYRKHFVIPASDLGKHISIQFDGIYRDALIFCNGFFLGHESSGYASQVYDLSDYLNYGGENVITVRADASIEEGWYYEGAGIYRHVWLTKSNKLHLIPFGTAITTTLSANNNEATLNIRTKVMNEYMKDRIYYIIQKLIDKDGKTTTTYQSSPISIQAKSTDEENGHITITTPHLWSLESPYLYTLRTEVCYAGNIIDSVDTSIGIRNILFDANKGFLLNGKQVKIKGVNIHLDHAGVGVAVPDELWRYRIQQLKKIGCNAIRSSHNPASPAMLDLCDKMGMLVVDENRSMGVNAEQLEKLQKMIERDRNHPSVILWSIGNEEWTIEGNETGKRIALSMSAFVHKIDSTRSTTAGIAGGTVLLKGLDVKGFNYIAQNDIDGYHRNHPDWKAVGTEETSGCGTRNVYYTDSINGWMAPLNRGKINGVVNIIERGWKFYSDRPWLGGLFYWTGFDYRGEPNPMVYPATGSQFGILDYCGFPKDEAYYLKAWWTNQLVLHLSPHWNLKGHEGDSVKVFAYSNCDEVELFVNGKSLGRKSMPKFGHLEWTTIYKPGKLFAQGYKKGEKTIKETIETTGEATEVRMFSHKNNILADGRDLAVVNLMLYDKKGRPVPDAMNDLKVSIEGPAIILGYGNGNPGFKEIERPTTTLKNELDIKAFSGKAQVLIQSIKGKRGVAVIRVSGINLKTSTLQLGFTGKI